MTVMTTEENGVRGMKRKIVRGGHFRWQSTVDDKCTCHFSCRFRRTSHVDSRYGTIL